MIGEQNRPRSALLQAVVLKHQGITHHHDPVKCHIGARLAHMQGNNERLALPRARQMCHGIVLTW